MVEHLDGHTDIVHKQLYRDWLPWLDSNLYVYSKYSCHNFLRSPYNTCHFIESSYLAGE